MNSNSSFTSEDISRSVEEIKRKRPDYTPMLDLYEKIFILQEKTKKAISLPEYVIPDDVLALKAKEKFPLVNISQFNVDNESSELIFTKICSILSESESSVSKSIKKITDIIDQKKLKYENIFSAILQENENFFEKTQEEFNIDKKMLSFIAFNSIKPSLMLFAEKLTHYLEKLGSWEKGYCPICGSAPAISVFEENGKRFLICSFCNHKWDSKRIYCPFCENTDHKKIHYFGIDDEEEYRVDVCDQCKKYIKTIDTKKTTRLIYPQLEFMSTPHIDIKIEKMGFKKGINYD
jgi:FdhE protein